jgi:hypothetical protein
MKDFFAGGGSGIPSISWAGAPIGAEVVGVLLPQRDEATNQEVAYRTEPQTQPDGTLKTWDDGSPRPQLVLLIQTAFRNRETVSQNFLANNPEFVDEGVRYLHISGSEVSKDIKEQAQMLGGPPKVGMRIRLRLVGREPTTKGNPRNVHSAQLGHADEASLAEVTAYVARQAAKAPAPAGDQFFAGQQAPAPAWGQQGPAAQQAPAPAWGQQGPAAQPAPAPAWGQQGPAAQPAPAPAWGQQGPAAQPAPAPAWGQQGPAVQPAPAPAWGQQGPAAQPAPAPAWGQQGPAGPPAPAPAWGQQGPAGPPAPAPAWGQQGPAGPPAQNGQQPVDQPVQYQPAPGTTPPF